MLNLGTLFLLFIIYSFIGWIIEIIDIYIYTKKIANRGFLIGPYCPIYGVGVILMTLFLKNSTDDLFGIFLKSMFICSVLEYFTSYLMEKIFRKRWWDYSKKKYNLNGRVCLENMLLFGIAGCITFKITNPFFLGLLSNLSIEFINISSLVLAVIFSIDLTVSFKIISKFRNIKFGNIDSTEEIKEKVNEFLNLNYIVNRLINAFPELKEGKLRKKS